MIDSHCHIAGDEFAADIDAVVARAQAAGVTSALCILSAGDVPECRRAERLHESWPALRFSVGIHPHQAGEYASDVAGGIALVRERAAAHRASAIGEIGLDYHYDFAPRPVQQEVFREQIRLANSLSLPIVIHTREATDDTFAILEEEASAGVRGVFHCFTGDAAMARRALDAGFHVSFSGIVTFPRADAIREAARMVPGDRLLAETDAPYLAPVPHRGKRNEPAHVARVIEVLAELRGVSPAEIDREVARNFEAVFGQAPL